MRLATTVSLDGRDCALRAGARLSRAEEDKARAERELTRERNMAILVKGEKERSCAATIGGEPLLQRDKSPEVAF
jgi:hypothetical protein